jgi:hypothetical protein
MNKHIFLVSVFLLTVVLAAILLTTNTNIKQKQYIKDDQPNIDNKYAPRVYELLYVKRDPKKLSVWLFSKSPQGTTSRFMTDIKNSVINHVLIYGKYYKATYISENDQYFYVNLVDQCRVSKQFISCGSAVPPSDQIVSVLHVLGYNFK